MEYVAQVGLATVSFDEKFLKAQRPRKGQNSSAFNTAFGKHDDTQTLAVHVVGLIFQNEFSHPLGFSVKGANISKNVCSMGTKIEYYILWTQSR